MMKRLLLAAAAAAVAMPALADFQKPQDAVEYRQSVMTVMGHHFGHIGAMVNGKAPFDATQAAADADVVAMMSKLPWGAFGPGTDKVADTHAKPEVWTETDKFKAAGQKSQEEAAKLAAVAKGGKLDEIKAQFGATAKTCKACHDDFRKK
jgi:cytochrome c556